MNRFKPVAFGALSAFVIALSACGGGGDNAADDSSGKEGADNPPAAKSGGEITVLEEAAFAGSWPAGLDPATNTNGAANQPYMDTIYGQLFKLVEGGEVVGELAESGTLSSDGKTFTVKLRPGVKFTDGSPLDAATVKWNFDRSLASPCTCNPKSSWPKLEDPAVTTSGDDTVEIHFTAPFAAVARSFISSNLNWMASKTTFDKVGEKAFKQKPVGAGPFTVVSNSPSNQLVLQKNPGYFRQGRPYLDKITFKTIGGDQAAYQAMQAGQADAYEGISTPAFDDQKARDAVYYATDAEAIRKGLFNNRYPNSQTFTGPGGLFYKPTVPGYKTFDLEKAKQLVTENGGLQVTLGTINVLVAK